MTRVIPNELTKVKYVDQIADVSSPTVSEIDGGTELTGFLVNLEAATSGQTVATPAFDSLFETNIPGTASGSFTAEMYRDDTTDTAWETLPRATSGFIVVARFGWSGGGDSPSSGDECEVWPIRVTTRSAMALTNNEVQRFSVEAAIPTEPAEDAVVAA
jgi:hypothetical protein